ncbi:hypothetical protein FACS189485_22120 [Spirochaetia bacterium]|nr:hypothetical protein FACS189485_22120 [Spirochaetia bacterium]
MAIDPVNPLIVQSDRTLLLDVHAPGAEDARAAIMPFAELEKSPEHIHTYRITPLSLWNAAGAGFAPSDIVTALNTYTRYAVPAGILEGFSDTMSRYGKIRLISPEQLTGAPPAAAAVHQSSPKDVPLESATEVATIAVEFRLADWYTNRVIEAMKKRGGALVAVDVPDIRGLPPAIDVVTDKTSYIRLHGRNRESWLWGSDSAARFDYLYNDKELESWGDRLQRIVLEADRVLVYFNNHRKGQAVQNAQTLIQILDKTGLSGDLVKAKGVKHDTTGDLPF